MNKQAICLKSVLIFTLLIILLSCSDNPTQQVALGKVTRGTFYIEMYEEGEIEAVNSRNISTPTISWRYGNLKITHLVKDGEEVNTGDTVAIFDPSEVHKAIIESEGNLEINLAEMEKMVAQHKGDIEELTANYEIAKISQEISRIELQSASYKSEVEKKQIELNLQKADINLERAWEEIENRKKMQVEDLKQKKLQIDQSRSMLNEAYETLNKLHVIAPASGIAIISRNFNTWNKFQVGEQCWSGFPLIQLPDLSKLKATVKINEVDILKVKKGMKCEIKPDAFSESVFAGSIYSVANLGVNKQGSNKIKVFPVEIYLDETHKNLLPGLTVSCRIIMDRIDDVLYIPIEAIIKEGDKEYVYKKSGGGYQKTEVETGNSNSDYIIITSGLKENDEIALSDPFYKETTDTNTQQ